MAAEKGTGIKSPNEVMASLSSWLPGTLAPSVKTTVVIHGAKEQIGVTLMGIDPRRELTVSKLETHMRIGQVMDLHKGSNSSLIGEGLAKESSAGRIDRQPVDVRRDVDSGDGG